MMPKRDFKLERGKHNLNVSKHSLNMAMCTDQSTRHNQPAHSRSKNIFEEHSKHFDDFCDKGSEFIVRSRSRQNKPVSVSMKQAPAERTPMSRPRSTSEKAQQYPKTNKNWTARAGGQAQAQTSSRFETDRLRHIKKMMEQIAGNNIQNSQLISDLLRNVDGSTEEKPKEQVFNSARSSAKTHNIYRTQSFSRYEARNQIEDGRDNRKRLSRPRTNTESGLRTEQSLVDQMQRRRKSSSMRANVGKRFTFSVPKQAVAQTDIEGFRSLFYQNRNRKRFLSSNTNEKKAGGSRDKGAPETEKEERRSERLPGRAKKVRKTRSHDRASAKKEVLSESSEDFAMTYESEVSRPDDDRLSSNAENGDQVDKSTRVQSNRQVSFSGKVGLLYGINEEQLQTIKSKRDSEASGKDNRVERGSGRVRKPRKERARSGQRRDKRTERLEEFLGGVMTLQKKVIGNQDKLNKIIEIMQREREEPRQREQFEAEVRSPEQVRVESLQKRVEELESQIREMQKEKQEDDRRKEQLKTEMEEMKAEKEKEQTRHAEKEAQLEKENQTQRNKHTSMMKKLKKEVDQLKEENTMFKAMNKVFKEQIEEKNNIIRFSMSVKNEAPPSKFGFYGTDSAKLRQSSQAQSDWRDLLKSKMSNIHQIKRKRSRLRNQGSEAPNSGRGQMDDWKKSGVNLTEHSWHSRGFSNPDFLRNVNLSRERNIYDGGQSELNLREPLIEEKFQSVKNLKRLNRHTLSPEKYRAKNESSDQHMLQDPQHLSAYDRLAPLTRNLVPLDLDNQIYAEDPQRNFSFQNQLHYRTPKIEKKRVEQNRLRLSGKQAIEYKSSGHFYSKQPSRKNSRTKRKVRYNAKTRLIKVMNRPDRDLQNHIRKKTVTFALKNASPAKQTNIYQQPIYMKKIKSPNEKKIVNKKPINLKSKKLKQKIKNIKRANRVSNVGKKKIDSKAKRLLQKKKKRSKSKPKDGKQIYTFVNIKNFTKPKKKISRFKQKAGTLTPGFSSFSRRVVKKKISQTHY